MSGNSTFQSDNDIREEVDTFLFEVICFLVWDINNKLNVLILTVVELL